MQTKSRNRTRTLMTLARRGVRGAVLMLAAAACRDEPTATAVRGGTDAGKEGKYHVGYVIGANGRPEKILYEVMGGDAVVEGDMVIGDAGGVPRTPEEALRAGPAGSRFSVAVSDADDFWPGGVIHYQFKANVSDTTRASALAGMALINRRNDGITFVETTSTTPPYLLIQDDNNTRGSCRGEVGPDSNGPTTINIYGCGAGVAAHEIMHTLGFHHEQSRCDRDDYIDLADSVTWTIRCTDVTYLGTGYDLLSIMHYDLDPGVSEARVDLWLPFEGVDASTRVGRRDSLSSCDNRALDSIYPGTANPVCNRSYASFASYHTTASYWGSERGIILDNRDSTFTADSWSSTTSASTPDYRNHHRHTTSGRRAWHTFQVPADTAYNFYMWAFQKPGVTAATAVYKLYSGLPSQITTSSVALQTWEWDQSQGLRWMYIGKDTLAAGTYTLQIEKKGGSGAAGTVFADAIRVTLDSNDPLN